MIEVGKKEIVIPEGPWDPHTHPRAFDAITVGDGKAGISIYTQAMLQSGFVGGNAMPNESLRHGRIDGLTDEKGYDSSLHPYPISHLEAVLHLEQRIATESVVDMGIIQGIDPDEAYEDGSIRMDIVRNRFESTKGSVVALKLYGGETEGGYQIKRKDIPATVEAWSEFHDGEPVVLHLEDDAVDAVLKDLNEQGLGDKPAHIAHVSSQQELQAVIDAKKRGQNVTCEVTLHHLTLTSDDAAVLQGQGCMKPTLKTADDVKFIRENIEWVDMFGSDCAPHRPNDKYEEPYSYGVTNHALALPMLVSEALKEDWIDSDKLYDMLVEKPRARFNIPRKPNGFVVMKLGEASMKYIEAIASPDYMSSPFTERVLESNFFGQHPTALVDRVRLEGHGDVVKDGQLSRKAAELTSFNNIVRPLKDAA